MHGVSAAWAVMNRSLVETVGAPSAKCVECLINAFMINSFNKKGNSNDRAYKHGLGLDILPPVFDKFWSASQQFIKQQKLSCPSDVL